MKIIQQSFFQNKSTQKITMTISSCRLLNTQICVPPRNHNWCTSINLQLQDNCFEWLFDYFKIMKVNKNNLKIVKSTWLEKKWKKLNQDPKKFANLKEC